MPQKRFGNSLFNHESLSFAEWRHRSESENSADMPGRSSYLKEERVIKHWLQGLRYLLQTEEKRLMFDISINVVGEVSVYDEEITERWC